MCFTEVLPKCSLMIATNSLDYPLKAHIPGSYSTIFRLEFGELDQVSKFLRCFPAYILFCLRATPSSAKGYTHSVWESFLAVHGRGDYAVLGIKPEPPTCKVHALVH